MPAWRAVLRCVALREAIVDCVCVVNAVCDTWDLVWHVWEIGGSGWAIGDTYVGSIYK